MPTDFKNNLNGGMNLDDSYYELPNNSYVDALNITGNGLGLSNDLNKLNVIGNRLVAYTKPTGTNVTIGAKADTVRNRVYEFVWNSNDKHSILIYDNATRVRTKLIENITDTGGVDVLEFKQHKKINHIDIINREDSEGDILSWTDGQSTPKELNVLHIQQTKYSVIKKNFIEAAKRPPLSPPTCVYNNDIDKTANALRKKLFMFTHRFSDDDYYKTTFSPYSKIPLPVGYYGSDNDIDNTKNNVISITVETGDENVASIEIAMRNNDGNNWDDFILIASLNKSELGIAHNTQYQYNFYNDSVYPILDQENDVAPLADWLPQLANAQCLPNGNVKEYAGITENFDNYPISDLDVKITATNVLYAPAVINPSISYVRTSPPPIGFDLSAPVTYAFTVNGDNPLAAGILYEVAVNVLEIPAPLIPNFYVLANYTTVGGDTNNSVALALKNYITTNYPSYSPSVVANTFSATLPTGLHNIWYVLVTASGGTGIVSTNKTWLPDANYIFGQVYINEQGLSMPGVATKSSQIDSNFDYVVNTPSFTHDTGVWKPPTITAEVNHLPKVGASRMNWVRRRQTYANFLMYETCSYQVGQGVDAGFLFFCLANIEAYKAANSQFIYGTAPIASDSRLKIIASIGSSPTAFTSVWNQDYEILGTAIKTLTGGAAPPSVVDNRLFIKVKAPVSGNPAYTQNMLVMVYTPMQNPKALADSSFFEFDSYGVYTGYRMLLSSLIGVTSLLKVGEILTGGTSGATAVFVGFGVTAGELTDFIIKDISGTFVFPELITASVYGNLGDFNQILGGANYHIGMTQDQTPYQPAKYVWSEGDVYMHNRTMFKDLVTLDSLSPNTITVMDASYSDFFPSGVNDNGRSQLIAVNAKRTYFPATGRNSLAYQQNTNINQLNRFLYNNFDDYDRSFGDILKLSIKDRYMRVGQKLKIGRVPIFNSLTKDSQGGELLAATDKLLNPIQYYSGDFGVGESAESWVDFNFSSYFFDTNRGIWCRLSQDGITPVSMLLKLNSWANKHGVLRKGNYKIYGVFDSNDNTCIFSFAATESDAAYTISFNEAGNKFESFLSYHPEMMCTLGNLLITWKNGDLWTHDSATFNNFYGVQYPSHISLVFNDKVAVKKVFNAVAFQSNQTWDSSTKGDVETSSINPQTLLKQESKIAEYDYDIENNPNRYAALNRDMNSLTDQAEALVEGDILSGNYIKIKFVCVAAKADKLVFFNKPYLTWNPDGRNF